MSKVLSCEGAFLFQFQPFLCCERDWHKKIPEIHFFLCYISDRYKEARAEPCLCRTVTCGMDAVEDSDSLGYRADEAEPLSEDVVARC